MTENFLSPRGTISHSFQDETIEAKTRWFQSLTIDERQELFADMMDLILEINPRIMEQKRAQPVEGRIRVVSKTQS